MDTKTPAENLSEMEREAWRGVAEAQYNAYGDSVGWKAVSGHPMPRFEEVGARVEGAWCIAARAGIEYYLERMAQNFVAERPAIIAETAEIKVAEGAGPHTYHIPDRKKMDAIKAQLHRSIDALFEKLEYDCNGELVNGIEVEQKREHTGVGVGGGRRGFIVTQHSLTVKIDETLASIERQITEIKKREGL